MSVSYTNSDNGRHCFSMVYRFIRSKLLRYPVIFALATCLLLSLYYIEIYYLAYIPQTSNTKQHLFSNTSDKNDEVKVEDKAAFFGIVEPGDIVYVLVVCQVKDSKTSATSSATSEDFKRQLQQVEVVLKTAAIFTKRTLHFIFVTDTVDTFLKLRQITNNWPKNMTRNLKITRRPLWEPPNQNKMMRVFRPCAAACLFLHETLPDVDAAINIDTDTLFLRSPEDLWTKFAQFDSRQFAGLSPCHYLYGPRFKKKFGFYGKSGINAGVILMNLTRMRDDHLSFDLTATFIEIFEKYEKEMPLVDQDILNHFYSLYPKLLYPIDCSWNMRPNICHLKRFPCRSEHNGISLLHGCAKTFISNTFPTFKEVFNTFLNFDCNKDDIRRIPDMLKRAFDKALSNKNKPCQKLNGFNEWVLTYPNKIISDKYPSDAVPLQ